MAHAALILSYGTFASWRGQLLHRFATQHEEAAFQLLDERHGPTVLSVSRRVLRHEQDPEDVFQATFLTLARKASPRSGSQNRWVKESAAQGQHISSKKEIPFSPRLGTNQ